MRPFLALIALLAVATPSFAADAPVHVEPQPNLTILVDENLLLPVSLLARHYATTTGTPLTVVSKNAAEAENQIEQGLEAHVLLTANQMQVDRLASQGLMDVSSTKPFARTQLALVATTALNKQDILAKRISFGATITATPELPVFINAPTTPEGERAAKFLHGYEFSNALAGRTQVKENRGAVLDALQESHGLALLLAADAIGQPDIVVISVIPPELSPVVNYNAVVLASESMIESRQFTNFLQSRKAQEILSHFGLQPAE